MFQLYTKEHKIFPFEDYEILLNKAKDAECVLEFGPGHSTYAFIEAEVKEIHTLEYQEAYYQQARRDFATYRNVYVGRFINKSHIYLDMLKGFKFDLAFVDAPIGEGHNRRILPGQELCSRYNTTRCALDHAACVLLHDCHRYGEQHTLKRLEDSGYRVKIHSTKKGVAEVW